jgi:hypothetical protein
MCLQHVAEACDQQHVTAECGPQHVYAAFGDCNCLVWLQNVTAGRECSGYVGRIIS